MDSVLDFWVVCASVRFGELELVKVMKGAAMVDITGITPGVKTTKFRWPRLSEQVYNNRLLTYSHIVMIQQDNGVLDL